MGMFDYVRCEYPLPDGRNPTANSYQTKDLYLELGLATITAEGQLLYRDYEEPESSNRNDDYTGSLSFYDFVSKTGEWFEYTAEFVDGKLQSITSEPPRPRIKHA